MSEAAVIVSVVSTGVFMGLMVTFMVVIRRVLAGVSAADYTGLWQRITAATDRPPTAPAVVIVGVLASLVALFGLRDDATSPAFVMTLVAWALFAFGVLGVTLAFNAPTNDAFAKASPEAPPKDWAGLRDRWNSWSWVRTGASAGALLLHVLVLWQVAGTPRRVRGLAPMRWRGRREAGGGDGHQHERVLEQRPPGLFETHE